LSVPASPTETELSAASSAEIAHAAATAEGEHASGNAVKPPRVVPPSSSAHHLVFPHMLDTARSFVSVVVIALFVLTFIVQPFRIPSESMERTLLVGDFLLVNKMAESPEGRLWSWILPYRHVDRGDVIVFHFPHQPGEHLVKRVIGIPGDHIRLIDGVVYNNRKAHFEPYAVYRGSYADSFRDQFPDGQYTDPGVDSHWWLNLRHTVKNGELVVPSNSYFVLGDNRNNSRDSRYWGFVNRPNIVGRPFVIYFSVRGISPTEVTPLPGDTLSHGSSLLSALLDFARWDRMFQIVR
jgi:signal peptidase I